jgi:hypothetical protein
MFTENMYYIHTDHLGSYCAVTNASKEVRQRNCFNPWGNFAFQYESNIHIKSKDIGLEFPITYRGFTGHEHYPYFKIINMNGRLYDPVIGRFFSPLPGCRPDCWDGRRGNVAKGIELTKSLLKFVQSPENQVIIHTKKLKTYKADPFKFDNMIS